MELFTFPSQVHQLLAVTGCFFLSEVLYAWALRSFEIGRSTLLNKKTWIFK